MLYLVYEGLSYGSIKKLSSFGFESIRCYDRETDTGLYWTNVILYGACGLSGVYLGTRRLGFW